MELFEQDLQQCLQELQAGNLVLFTTEYGWCIGCDATQEVPVIKVRQLLHGLEQSGLPVLLTEEREVLQWVAAADLSVFDCAAEQTRPTAIRLSYGLGFADSLPAPDGSVLIYLTQNPFCRHLVKRFRKPVVALPVSVVEQTKTHGGLPDNIRTVVAYTTLQAPPEKGALTDLQVLEWNNGDPVTLDYR